MAPKPPALGYQVPVVRKNLGKRLKQLRLHHGFYRPTVCRAIDIRCSPSHLADIERGRSDPRISLLLHLANLYGVTINYLVSDAPLHFELRDSVENLRGGTRFR